MANTRPTADATKTGLVSHWAGTVPPITVNADGTITTNVAEIFGQSIKDLLASVGARDGNSKVNPGDDDVKVNLGVAISGSSGSGTWWYRAGSGSWMRLADALTGDRALLLGGNALSRLYYQSAATETGTPSITFRVWDTQGQGGAVSAARMTAGSSIAVSALNEGTAFSETNLRADFRANTRPTITAGTVTIQQPLRYDVWPKDNTPAGMSVAELIETLKQNGITISDGETAGGRTGLAFSVQSAPGTRLLYSVDGGASFHQISNFVLFPDDKHTRIAVVSDTGTSLTVSVRAVDRSGVLSMYQASGTAAGTAMTTNTTSENAATVTFNLGPDVRVADPPQIDFSKKLPLAQHHYLVDAPTASMQGRSVFLLPQPGDELRIAHHACRNDGHCDHRRGSRRERPAHRHALLARGFERRVADGQSCRLSDRTALLLAPSAQLFFVPNDRSSPGPAGRVSDAFTFKVWNQSSGTASAGTTAAYGDSTVRSQGQLGAVVSAFSEYTARATQLVIDANLAPTLSAVAAANRTFTEPLKANSATQVTQVWTEANLTLEGANLETTQRLVS